MVSEGVLLSLSLRYGMESLFVVVCVYVFLFPSICVVN